MGTWTREKVYGHASWTTLAFHPTLVHGIQPPWTTSMLCSTPIEMMLDYG
jgi:hypothetical protein